jgi:two-component system sensor histidine kinase YesM
MVPLAQELEWLEQYLFLQKSRFNDSFQYFVHMDPSLAQAKIYKLLLQPFVENTILHGFAGKRAGAELHIRFSAGERGCLCIELNDNGCGMDEATVAKILERGGERPAGSGSGIGIRNVMERLHLYYGDRAHCRIESAIGEGTTVILMLPNEPAVLEEESG